MFQGAKILLCPSIFALGSDQTGLCSDIMSYHFYLFISSTGMVFVEDRMEEGGGGQLEKERNLA